MEELTKKEQKISYVDYEDEEENIHGLGYDNKSLKMKPISED